MHHSPTAPPTPHRHPAGSVLDAKVSAAVRASRSKSRDLSDLSAITGAKFLSLLVQDLSQAQGRDPGDTGHVGAQLVSGAAAKTAGPRELQRVGAERAFWEMEGSRAELLLPTGPRGPRRPHALRGSVGQASRSCTADHGWAGSAGLWPPRARHWEQPRMVSVHAARPCPAPARPSPGFVLEIGLCALSRCV